jgi:hypothetical protein
MKRREFITLLGGAAAWPLTARAQQSAKLPTIGYLGASTPLFDTQRVGAFVQRLRELGWIEGRTVAIEYRWSEGRTERFSEIAGEFVRSRSMSSSRGAAESRQRSRPHQRYRSCSLWQETRLAAVLLQPWHDREAILPVCRCSRPMLRASGWSFCAMPCPVSGEWRSW